MFPGAFWDKSPSSEPDRLVNYVRFQIAPAGRNITGNVVTAGAEREEGS